MKRHGMVVVCSVNKMLVLCFPTAFFTERRCLLVGLSRVELYEVEMGWVRLMWKERRRGGGRGGDRAVGHEIELLHIRKKEGSNPRSFNECIDGFALPPSVRLTMLLDIIGCFRCIEERGGQCVPFVVSNPIQPAERERERPLPLRLSVWMEGRKDGKMCMCM